MKLGFQFRVWQVVWDELRMGWTSGRDKRLESIRTEHGKFNFRRNIGLTGTKLKGFKKESNSQKMHV